MRVFAAILLFLGMALPASGKLLCTSGRFILHPTGNARGLEGRELVLGEGDATVTDACRTVRARGYHSRSQLWLSRVRAAWGQCGGGPLALRARWNLASGSYCTRLEGTLRVGPSRRVAFVADRIPECGNKLREPGEQCDDGTESACCGLDCRVKPGCAVACDAVFPCGADEICVPSCDFGAKCQPRSEVFCGGWPVCGCDEKTMYANRCAAYEAGAGWRYTGPCRRYCAPRGDDCLPNEFCTPIPSAGACERWLDGRGLSFCLAIPYTCDGTPDALVCGCDGTTYRNDCELRRARMGYAADGPCS